MSTDIQERLIKSNKQTREEHSDQEYEPISVRVDEAGMDLEGDDGEGEGK